jgi:uncharacterized protein YbjQ (UPF0145 family)
VSALDDGPDLKTQLQRAAAALDGRGGRSAKTDLSTGPSTSDLSIDEVLLLHTINWEPVDLVCGVSFASIPQGVWRWGVGEIVAASSAHTLAVATAVNRMQRECRSAGGHGVVGVHIELEIEPHHVKAVLVGTAVRPLDAHRKAPSPFVSDLSTRDFTLLHNAGWQPVGLAFGASFVHAPRRSAGTAMAQKSQNVELTNFTEAMYDSRERAMERMQTSALDMRGQGVVAVQVSDGPMHFAHHAVRFTAWGTAVRLGDEGHKFLQPQVILPLDDAVVTFDASSLR